MLGSFFYKAFAGSFDIVLSGKVATAKTMRSERVCQQNTVICATPDYLKSHDKITS